MPAFTYEHTPCRQPVRARLILGSASPRRTELCRMAGLEFTVRVADCDETVSAGTPPVVAVEHLAARKARAVEALLRGEAPYHDTYRPWILAADTLVEIDGVPLGKPTDPADAVRMLHMLSGHTHRVHTGVALIAEGKLHTAVDSTAVTFRPLSEQEIWDYVASGEPLDKAGAYAIQGQGGKLVDSISGRFDTVVGLSMRRVSELMERAMSETLTGK